MKSNKEQLNALSNIQSAAQFLFILSHFYYKIIITIIMNSSRVYHSPHLTNALLRYSPYFLASCLLFLVSPPPPFPSPTLSSLTPCPHPPNPPLPPLGRHSSDVHQSTQVSLTRLRRFIDCSLLFFSFAWVRSEYSCTGKVLSKKYS